MNLNTGFGYYVKNGKKLRKFELSTGYHPDPVGYEYVEVNSKEELDRIVLDKSDEQIAYEEQIAQKESHRNNALKKLQNMGLTADEINAIIGE